MSSLNKDNDRPTILLLSGVQGDTRRYRCFHAYEQLKLVGVEVQLSHITDPLLIKKAENASVFILHRTSYDLRVKQLLKLIEQQAGLAILDTDDLIFDHAVFRWIDSPDFQDPWRAALYQEDMRRHRMTLEACQAAIASTDFLAEQVRTLQKPVWVHRNAFSQAMLAISEAAYQQRAPHPGRIVIGYASGTPTHDRDFSLVKPALRHILQRFPQAELWTVGPVNPGTGWGETAARVRRHRFMPWRELPRLLVQFDINLAPLVADNPFSQSKSEIKYVEAALVRVPTIASPSDAFQYAIRSGENGYLANDTHDWVEALTMLCEQADLRRSTGERAHAQVLQDYHPAKRGAEFLATLQTIFQSQSDQPLPASISTAGKITPVEIDPRLESGPSLLSRGLYSLRYRGLRTLALQIWIYFRRMLAPLFPYRLPDTQD